LALRWLGQEDAAIGHALRAIGISHGRGCAVVMALTSERRRASTR
jgi:hypothetical protein